MRHGRLGGAGRILALAALSCVAIVFAAGGVIGVPAASAAQRSVATTLTPMQSARPLPRDRAEVSALQTSTGASPGNFPFQTTTSSDGRIIVHWYGQPSDFGQEVITLAQSALSITIIDTLGFTLLRPVNIYVYASRADFLAGAPVDDPDETGALTIFTSSTVYMESGSDNPSALSSDLPHELTHIVFHQNQDSASIASYFVFFPRWLDEGLAASDEGPNFYQSTLDQAVQNHALVDILKIFNNDYPPNLDVNYLAYAESRAFILYLEKTFGADTFHQFLRDVRDGNLNLAAERRFGAGLATLEGRWENSLGALPSGINLGYLPTPPSAAPYTPGKLSSTAGTLQPFAVSAEGVLPSAWLILLVVILLASAAITVSKWSPPRPQSPGVVIPCAQPTPYAADLWLAAETLSPPDAPTSAALAPIPPLALPKPYPVDQTLWYDALLALAPLPLAALAGLLTVRLNALHEWRLGYLVAFAVALLFLGATLVVAKMRRHAEGRHAEGRHAEGRHAEGRYMLRLLAVCMTALLSFATLTQIAPSGQLQVTRYESQGAFALALRYAGEAGYSDANLASIHGEWASAASSARDYQTETSQLRAEIALEIASKRAADQATLLRAVETWGMGLRGNGSFSVAIQVYDDQAAYSGCTSACRREMHTDAANASLAWGDTLFLKGDLSGAHTQYQAVLHNYAGTAAAGAAQQGYDETGSRLDLAAAVAAGDRGDYSSMNAQLRALAKDYFTTAALQDAQSMPQPVTGVIRDSSGASVAGDRLFLLGFSSASAARAFGFDFNPDSSLVKVATTLRGDGSFTARLTPDLWYIACWDDSSQSTNGNFNSPDAFDNDAFTVARYTPENIGVIIGY